MIARPVWLHRVAEPGYSLLLALLILGPLLGPGYLLLRDAVSTPRSYLTDSALGLSDAAARAVPQDAAVAALSTVLDGGLVVKTILLLALVAAGWGAARMVAATLPTVGLGGRLLASTVTLWNPYVAERLLQGHWSLLTGYAALPWIVVAAVRIRGTARLRSAAVVAPPALALAAAGLTPTGAVLAATLLLVLLAVPGGRSRRGPRVLVGVLLAVAASAPWLTATVLSGAGAQGADPAGVAAFAARAEPGLATLGSLAGLGGIWNAAAVPGSRATGWALVGTVMLLAVVACGLPALVRRRGNPVLVAVAALAAAAVLLPALAATGWGLAAGEWAVVHVPGYGLLRDAQKWVALAVPFYALAAAAGVGALARTAARVFAPDRPAHRPRTGVAAAVAIVAVLAALPDLALGVGGAVRPVHYPASWQRVAALLDGAASDVAVLPAGTFRRFPYSGPAPVLDPAPRMLPLDVPQTGRLLVLPQEPTFTGPSFVEITGEGGRAAEIELVLVGGGTPDDLALLGVGWVLVEKDTPGVPGDTDLLADLELVYDDDHLALYRLPGWVAFAPESATQRRVLVAAHLVWAALLAGGALGCVLGARRASVD
ncbi:hypothetical protein ACFWPA_17775 [Rhodococcus sp. NPDC058505]|uniref:hypothetical protein n=1 Tax=unclassified Rhodococcus (in: high G+C Gram-positive bacteria) TaxID=192944 RepID=UPI003664E016